MNQTKYNRIVNICTIIVVLSALFFDRLHGWWKLLLGMPAIVAGVVAVSTYFRYHFDLQKEQEKEAILTAIGTEEISAAEIMHRTEISSGTLYPLLLKMEKDGQITSEWDSSDTYPRRRLYKRVI